MTLITLVPLKWNYIQMRHQQLVTVVTLRENGFALLGRRIFQRRPKINFPWHSENFIPLLSLLFCGDICGLLNAFYFCVITKPLLLRSQYLVCCSTQLLRSIILVRLWYSVTPKSTRLLCLQYSITPSST